MNHFWEDIIEELCEDMQTLENLRNEIISSVKIVRFIKTDKKLWEHVTAIKSKK